MSLAPARPQARSPVSTSAPHIPPNSNTAAREETSDPLLKRGALRAEGASHAAPEAERGGAGGREAKHIKPLQNAQGERRRDRFLIVRRDGLQGTHGSGTRGSYSSHGYQSGA